MTGFDSIKGKQQDEVSKQVSNKVQKHHWSRLDMGLDQFAYLVAAKDAINDTKFNYQAPLTVEEHNECIRLSKSCPGELYYWRKRWDFQGWMHRLFVEKGGDPENGTHFDVRLTVEDLQRLSHDVTHGELHKIAKKHFGCPDEDWEAAEPARDMEFIDKAMAVLSTGDDAVYYGSCA